MRDRVRERERQTEIKFRLDLIRACVELKKCCTFIFPSLFIPKWWSFSLPTIDRAINRVACASRRERGREERSVCREGEAPSCKCWLLLRLALTTADVWLPSWALYLWDRSVQVRSLADWSFSRDFHLDKDEEGIYILTLSHYVRSIFLITAQLLSNSHAPFGRLPPSFCGLIIRAHCNCNSICLWVRP